MRLSLVRLVATLLFSGQMLPVGLPLLCDQVQRRTSANCDQPMASHPSRPVVDATTRATQCVSSAFCATTATAVVAPSGAVAVALGASHIVAFGTSTFAPADPQPPLPPPPQAQPLPDVVSPDAPSTAPQAPARSAANRLAWERYATPTIESGPQLARESRSHL